MTSGLCGMTLRPRPQDFLDAETLDAAIHDAVAPLNAVTMPTILFDAHDGGAARDPRIRPAVAEINQHPDQQPADKPVPGRDVE
jgi:hypothetical protein